jgi:hypothetical protein
MLSRHPGLELNDLIVGLQLRKTKNAVDYRFVYPRVVDNRQLYRRTVILAERVHVFGTCTGLNVEDSDSSPILEPGDIRFPEV